MDIPTEDIDENIFEQEDLYEKYEKHLNDIIKLYRDLKKEMSETKDKDILKLISIRLKELKLKYKNIKKKLQNYGFKFLEKSTNIDKIYEDSIISYKGDLSPINLPSLEWCSIKFWDPKCKKRNQNRLYDYADEYDDWVSKHHLKGVRKNMKSLNKYADFIGTPRLHSKTVVTSYNDPDKLSTILGNYIEGQKKISNKYPTQRNDYEKAVEETLKMYEDRNKLMAGKNKRYENNNYSRLSHRFRRHSMYEDECE